MDYSFDVVAKRIYEAPSEKDGYRVLVDRLWPRGVKKERARLDEWNKTVAPSTELRKWFGHEATRFEEFTKRYKEELADHPQELERLREIAKNQRVTLLFATKATEYNHAVVLRDLLASEKSQKQDGNACNEERV
jgi:uncharacterized protein YeaO (DUF488 family)